jgi:uncharacterized protein GlcG (DUF336 family)
LIQTRRADENFTQEENLMLSRISVCVFALACASEMAAQGRPTVPGCSALPTPAQLQTLLNSVAPIATEASVASGPIGGLFNGTRMWAAVVNRDGNVCAAAASRTDPTQVWPGSQAIAKAKAYTANAFSLDTLALSTAVLYTFTQPGHSLWSLGQSNPSNPQFLAAPGNPDAGAGQIQGGLIFFGGGVPLYQNGKIIGGLGISGDTSCADHETAKLVRNAAALNPPGGMLVDDISYDQGASPDKPSVFTHPLCLNTWKNGAFKGSENPATGY